jgi:hypothetical protein
MIWSKTMVRCSSKVLILFFAFVASATAKLYEAPELTMFVDLRGAANMGLADEQMDDHKGGWLDQGGNDVAMLPVGMNKFAGIPFEVIDPAKNHGKAAIMLYGKGRPFFPKETIWIPVDKQCEYLYMLHGVGWVPGSLSDPYMKILVKYEDGSIVEIPLRIGQEAYDWHSCKPAENGPLAWVGKNSQIDRIGLHLFQWKNPAPKKFIKEIKFQSLGLDPVAGILGVTLASQKLPLEKTSTQLKEIDYSREIVKYRARIPLCGWFSWAKESEITLRRSLPRQVEKLVSMEFLVRFGEIRKPGKVKLIIGNKTYEQTLRPINWVVKFEVKDPAVIEAIRKNPGDFTVKIVTDDGLALGKFNYNTSPNAQWIPGGEDTPHAIYGVSYTAFFNTSDKKLAKWGRLELPYPGREKPAAIVETKTPEPISTLDLGPRAGICLNGIWQLASGPPDKTPQLFGARARVPGAWYQNTGLTEKDALTHSVWYKTRFRVPAGFGQSGKLILNFGKVSYFSTVYLNGKKLGTHLGDIEPFSFDVSNLVKPQVENTLLVCVEDNYTHFPSIQKRLKLDPKNIRGVEGKAFLWTLPQKCGRQDNPNWSSTLIVYENGKKLGPAHTQHQDIRDNGSGRYSHWGGDPETLYFSSSDNTDPRTNGRNYEVEYSAFTSDRISICQPYDGPTMNPWSGIFGDVTLDALPQTLISDVFITPSVRNKTITVKTEISDPGFKGQVLQSVWKDGKKILDLPAGLSVSSPWENPHLWDINDPYMYYLRTDLADETGKIVDRKFTPFGFRELWNEGTTFYFNGRRFRIQGDSPSVTWYVTPCENRLYERTRMELWRTLNVNLLRHHVSGMNVPEFCDTADEMGVLVTLEAPGVPFEWIYDSKTKKIIPERLAVIKEQYRQWARRVRNHPALVTYSLYNEFWPHLYDDKEEVKYLTTCLGSLKELNDVVRKEDPSRYTQLHGSEAYRQHGVPWTRITNMHYQWQDQQTNHWKQEMKNRPLIMGEIAFEGTWTFFSSNLQAKVKSEGLDAAADFYYDKLKSVAGYITAFMDLYRARDLSGIMPYEILQWAAPLNDPRGFCNDPVPFQWPAMSGPGQKPPQLEFERIKYMNWYDPKLPKACETLVTDAVSDHFEPQPLGSFKTRPEIIILVEQAGKPLANIPVILKPLDRQATSPVGCVTDGEGKAWFVVPEGGQYLAVIALPEKILTVKVTPEPNREFSAVKTVMVKE